MIDRLIAEYIESEEINPKKYKRLIVRKHHLNSFKEFLGYRVVEDIRLKEVIEYQGWLIERGRGNDIEYSSSTINEYISAVSNFYDYLKSTNVVFENPFKSLKKLRLDKKIPRNILSEKDMDKLLRYFREWNKEPHLKRKTSLYKMHVITELMYSTGLRVHEVSNLTIDDINLSGGSLLVREGKGGFTRSAVLNDYTSQVLKHYINEMREVIFTRRNIANSDLLFGLKEGYLKKYVNECLLKATLSLGLPKVTSHGFRHALGYHLLRSGCSLRHIQTILGHKNIRNTEIYTKVDKKDLKKVLNQYHPRQFKRIKDEANTK